MKISTKLILTTTILATSAFAAVEQDQTNDYDLVLEQGGTIVKDTNLTLSNASKILVYPDKVLKVYGSIIGEGDKRSRSEDGTTITQNGNAIDGRVEVYSGAVTEFAEETDSSTKSAIGVGDNKLYVLTEGQTLEGSVDTDNIDVPNLETVGGDAYDLSALTDGTMVAGNYAYMASPSSNKYLLTIEGGTESQKEVKANLINPTNVTGFESVDIQVTGKLKLSGDTSALSGEKTFMVGSDDETATELETVTLPDMALTVYPHAEMVLQNPDEDNVKIYEFKKDATVYKGGKLTIKGSFNLSKGTMQLGKTKDSSAEVADASASAAAEQDDSGGTGGNWLD